MWTLIGSSLPAASPPDSSILSLPRLTCRTSCYSWLNAYPGGPDAAIADGKIVALNDYIENMPPILQHILRRTGRCKEIMTDSGNIYCFPAIYTYTSRTAACGRTLSSVKPYDETFIGLIIRKDLLDKAGLDIPVTLDDWYEALVAFKDMGIKHPISFQATYADAGSEFCISIRHHAARCGHMRAWGSDFALREDGTIQYGPAQDSYKEYLAFMHRLYEEGLLDPGFYGAGCHHDAHKDHQR